MPFVSKMVALAPNIKLATPPSQTQNFLATTLKHIHNLDCVAKESIQQETLALKQK